jgi:hypothetical protein
LGSLILQNSGKRGKNTFNKNKPNPWELTEKHDLNFFYIENRIATFLWKTKNHWKRAQNNGLMLFYKTSLWYNFNITQVKLYSQINIDIWKCLTKQLGHEDTEGASRWDRVQMVTAAVNTCAVSKRVSG